LFDELFELTDRAMWKNFFGSLAVKWSVTHNVKKGKCGKKHLTEEKQGLRDTMMT